MLPEADDGKVTVAATRVDGMDDFLVVDKSHRYITRSDIIFRNTEAFLRTGQFLDTDKDTSLTCSIPSDSAAQPSPTCF